MDLVSAIRKRHSVRRFNSTPLPKEVIDQVVAAGRQATALYPKIGIRWFVAWEGSIVARSLGGIAGVYGMLTTAPHFIIAVSEEHPGYMENLGFRMEQMILTATTLGLGTRPAAVAPRTTCPPTDASREPAVTITESDTSKTGGVQARPSTGSGQ